MMTLFQKIEAIRHMLHNDGALIHEYYQAYNIVQIYKGFNDGSCCQYYLFVDNSRICTEYAPNHTLRNEIGLDLMFQNLAHKEYLKKKAEFAKPKRNKKGQFSTNY